ncbi:MAG: hypothetical protein QOD76_2213 [Solirubrobacteraceae bacterium]|nr:hypothetical protein [Solirubrobacteraceae bacterium]
MRSVKRFLVAVAAFATTALLAATASALAAPPVAVSGTFAEPVPPVITAYDPGSGNFYAYGGSVWTGTWSGATTWTTSGTVNLLTGDVKGTIDETFIGRSDDGGTGTLRFTETYTVNGAASTIHIDAVLLDGTGDFAGSRGHVIFDGLQLPSGQGQGTYTGTWNRSGAASEHTTHNPKPSSGHPGSRGSHPRVGRRARRAHRHRQRRHR